jgi:Ulp1 family protease
MPKKVLIFSSHFFNSLVSDSNVFDYDRVKGYTKAKNMRADCPNLFAYHVLIIPVNHQNSHWFLVKVDFVERTIRVYDSLVSTDVG